MKTNQGFFVILTCFLALFLTATKGYSETVCSSTPVMLQDNITGDWSTHATITGAYDTAFGMGLTDITLKLAAGSLTEDLTFWADLSVVLDDGYDDCSFVTKSSTTGIIGSITILAGTVQHVTDHPGARSIQQRLITASL